MVNENDPRHVYRNETWVHDHATYSPSPVEFLGVGSNTNPFDVFPTILELWELFWPPDLLCKIICKTSRYVGMVIDPLENTMEGASMGSTHSG